MDSELENRIASEVDSQFGDRQLIERPRKATEMLSSVFGDTNIGDCHNFVGTRQEVWRQVSRAVGSGCLSSVDAVGRTINLVHYYAHRVDIANESSGEVNSCIRVVLFDADGTRYQFVSEYVARDLARLISAFGNVPFCPPIALIVRHNKGKGSHHFYTVEPA